MSYNSNCNSVNCTTTYTISGDGFWDPLYDWDGQQRGGEFGMPYEYEDFSWSETFSNPGYQVDGSGNPQPIDDRVTPGCDPSNSGAYGRFGR